MSKMKTFLVGGAVRDGLLGLPVSDRDWVVVGATEEDQAAMLAEGFESVGQDFPVFLHPETKEEHALARKERKVGPGYKGFECQFDPSVSLEDDLLRRDLTINAMARDPETDELLDPHGGLQDLRDSVLRHTSEAFAEDPVRVLRLARFYARFGDFSVHPETVELCKRLVDDGELDHLVPERVWAELWKNMETDEPCRFFHLLKKVGAYDKLFPELEKLVFSGYFVTRAALRNAPKLYRFALLFTESDPKAVQKMLKRLKAPAEVMKFVKKFMLMHAAVVASENRNGAFGVWDMDPDKMLSLLKSVEAFRQPDDMYELSAVFGVFSDERQQRMDQVLKAFRLARRVTFATLPPEKQKLKGAARGKAIAAAQKEKFAAVL